MLLIAPAALSISTKQKPNFSQDDSGAKTMLENFISNTDALEAASLNDALSSGRPQIALLIPRPEDSALRALLPVHGLALASLNAHL